jgi:hypothetical protein
MRTARAYLAGFGTAGSLLAGAALLFVLASALVAFHGWPQMGAGAAPVSVTVPPAPDAGGSRVARRLAAILTAPGAPGVPLGGVVATRSVARRAGAGAKPGGARRVAGGTAVPVSTSASGGARASTGAPVGSGGTGAGGSGGGGPARPVRRILTSTTTTVRHVVSRAGNQLGSAIRQVGSAAGGALTTAAHAVAGAVTALQPPAG